MIKAKDVYKNDGHGGSSASGTANGEPPGRLPLTWTRLLLVPSLIPPIIFFCAWAAEGFPSFDPFSSDFWGGGSFVRLIMAEPCYEQTPWVPCGWAWQVMAFLAVFIGLAFSANRMLMLVNQARSRWLDELHSRDPGAGESEYKRFQDLVDKFEQNGTAYASWTVPSLFVYFVFLLLYPNRYIPWIELMLVVTLTLIPFLFFFRFEREVTDRISKLGQMSHKRATLVSNVMQRKPDDEKDGEKNE